MTSNAVDTRLSYSSASLLQSCSQKYFFHKVSCIARDPDSEDDQEAFNIGKAFHFVLEKTNHMNTSEAPALLCHALKVFKVEDKAAMIHAMLKKYFEMHTKSGLKVVKTEFALSTESFVGFIDAIMIDEVSGAWYIVDMKTAAMISKITLAKLHNDFQLNLYSYFADSIAEQFFLKKNLFAGCRYRVITKTKLKQKAGEDYKAYVERQVESVRCLDIVVPKDFMDPGQAFSMHAALHAKSMKLRAGTEAPFKNFHACSDYFKPCQFWSQCHKKTYTECEKAIVGYDEEL